MDRLPEPLTTFRQFIEADMRRAARLIIRLQDEIDPQFRIATPEGDYHLAVPLPKSHVDRRPMMRRVSTFMAWKQAASFIMASEIVFPDAVYALGVSQMEAHACMAHIAREPRPWAAANFGPVQWLDPRQIGQELLDLLPRGARVITAAELEMLEKWFGPEGRCPVVHLASGELRGV